MSYKVLELYLMNACLSRLSLINLGEALSLNIITMQQLITIEQCFEHCKIISHPNSFTH